MRVLPPSLAALIVVAAAGCATPAVDVAGDCFDSVPDAPEVPLQATSASDGSDPMGVRLELRDAADALYEKGARVVLVVRSGTSSAERSAEFRAGIRLPEGVERLSGDVVTSGPVVAGECLRVESVLRASADGEVVLVGYASFVDERGIAGDDHATAALRFEPSQRIVEPTGAPELAYLSFEWDADTSALRIIVSSEAATPFEVRLSWDPRFTAVPATYAWRGALSEGGRDTLELNITADDGLEDGTYELVSAYLVLAPDVPPVDREGVFRMQLSSGRLSQVRS